eukprot:m.286931 g.286931  ORF g.286931 m.286931 type:complete len:363 (+) comp11670_c0_seq1:2029-3117(+)
MVLACLGYRCLSRWSTPYFPPRLCAESPVCRSEHGYSQVACCSFGSFFLPLVEAPTCHMQSPERTCYRPSPNVAGRKKTSHLPHAKSSHSLVHFSMSIAAVRCKIHPMADCICGSYKSFRSVAAAAKLLILLSGLAAPRRIVRNVRLDLDVTVLDVDRRVLERHAGENGNGKALVALLVQRGNDVGRSKEVDGRLQWSHRDGAHVRVGQIQADMDQREIATNGLTLGRVVHPGCANGEQIHADRKGVDVRVVGQHNERCHVKRDGRRQIARQCLELDRGDASCVDGNGHGHVGVLLGHLGSNEPKVARVELKRKAAWHNVGVHRVRQQARLLVHVRCRLRKKRRDPQVEHARQIARGRREAW